MVEMQQAPVTPIQPITAVAEDTQSASRYLCAGAHLDGEFAHNVVEALFEQQHRAAAPSYGIDLAPILWHCFAARRRRVLRDILVLAAVAWNVLFNLPGLFTLWLFVSAGYSLLKRLRSSAVLRAVAVGVLMGLLLVGLVAIACITVLAATIHGTGSLGEGGVVTIGFAVTIGYLLLQGLRSESAIARAVARGITGTIVAVASSVAIATTGLPPLLRGTSGMLGSFGLLRGHTIGAVLGLALLLSIGQALLVWLPVMISYDKARRVIVTKLQMESFPRAKHATIVPPWLENRFQELTEGQRGNLTVYSGFLPFVGAGENIGGWSVTVDLSEGANGSTPVEFETTELLGYVTKRLEDRLVNVDKRFSSSVTMPIEVDGRAIIHWKAMRGSELFSGPRTAPPIKRVSQAFIEELIRKPTPERRHYLRIQTRLWGNEVVVTTFLYLDVKGSTLYVEAVRCVLYPVRSSYHQADFLPNSPSLLEWIRIVQTTLLAVPGVIRKAPVSIFRTLTLSKRSARWGRIVRLAVRDRRPVDYGARTSVRELGADKGFHNYYQHLDAVEALKLSQHHILDAIFDFLESKQISTQQFRSRRDTILNMGIMFGEGSTLVNTGNFAVGPGSSVIGGSATAESKEDTRDDDIEDEDD